MPLSKLEGLSTGQQNLQNFLEISQSVVNSLAPIQRKYIRANQAPFMSKELQKEIMFRSKLRNKFLQTKSLNDKKAFNKQRNKCVNLLRQTKKKYYSNLQIKDVVDNKKFWKCVKIFFF